MLISKQKYDADLDEQRKVAQKQTALYNSIKEENAQLQVQLTSMKDMLRLEMIKSAAAASAAGGAGGGDGGGGGGNEMIGALQKEMDQMKRRHGADLDSMLKRLKDKDAQVAHVREEESRKQDRTRALEATTEELKAEVAQLKAEAAKAGPADDANKEAHAKVVLQLQVITAFF
jgi:hypothetical protein